MEAGRIVGVIPARLNSSRLPRKVLRLICGQPMIQHVYQQARQCDLLDDLVVATDAEEVRHICDSLSIPAIMTSPDHASGTDRVFEVAGRCNADVVVNIQGDEPLLSGEHVERLVSPFVDDAVQVSTLRVPLADHERANPNVVKVVCNLAGDALYFSRSMIPFDRDGTSRIPCYKHLGFYAYRRTALQQFHGWGASDLESTERLEQLRFLDHGVPIRTIDAPFATTGVDTEDDLRLVEQILNNREAA